MAVIASYPTWAMPHYRLKLLRPLASHSRMRISPIIHAIMRNSNYRFEWAQRDFISSAFTDKTKARATHRLSTRTLQDDSCQTGRSEEAEEKSGQLCERLCIIRLSTMIVLNQRQGYVFCRIFYLPRRILPGELYLNRDRLKLHYTDFERGYKSFF